MLIKKLLKIFLSAAIFVLPAFTFAQSVSLSISASPANPTPGESVYLSLSSPEFDIDLAQISWKVDGKAKESGVGKKTISVLAPTSGKALEVSATAVSGGRVANASTRISAGEIDLIWESIDGYTPPFYRGKTLPITQGQVKVAAIPNIKTVSGSTVQARNFAYNWVKDSSNVGGQSGFGKSSMNFTNQNLEATNRVDVSVTDGLHTAKGSIVISYFEPEIHFYQLLASSGIHHEKSIKNNTVITGDRVILVAEPYFLPKNLLTDANIKTVWKLNNVEVKPTSKNTLIINTRTPGTFTVGFTYDDTKKLFRDMTENLTLVAK